MNSVYSEVDGTIVLSDFHEQILAKNDGYSGPFLRAVNGIDPAEFVSLDWSARDDHRAIYASAPNRGLSFLLDAWPLIRAVVPNATLEIYYDWTLTQKMMSKNLQLRAELEPLFEKLEHQLEALRDSGVQYFGGVDHTTLNAAYARAGIWAYPVICFDEIFCISALRAQACGAYPVTVDRGAIREVVQFGTITEASVSIEHYAELVVQNMLYPPSIEDRKRAANTVVASWSWDKAATQFLVHARGKKLRLNILAHNSPPFDGASLHRVGQNVGGSEEAVICLSRALAARGVEVDVFTSNRDSKIEKIDGVFYSSSNIAVHVNIPTVIFRSPKQAAEWQRVDPHRKVISWLMDPAYADVNHAELAVPGTTVVLTQAHAEMLGTPAATIIHNGLDLSELPPLSEQNDLGRHPEWVMWATSPDRGLVHLLRMWPRVLTAVPKAQLHIFYGIEQCYARAKQDGSYDVQYGITECQRLLESNMPGVFYHGSTPRTEFIAQHVRCGTFAYTNDNFNETFSMSMVRAIACGMNPVFVAAGSLPEVSLGAGVGVDPGRWDVFERELINAMINPPPFATRKRLATSIRERFSLDRMADEFYKLLTAMTS